MEHSFLPENNPRANYGTKRSEVICPIVNRPPIAVLFHSGKRNQKRKRGRLRLPTLRPKSQTDRTSPRKAQAPNYHFSLSPTFPSPPPPTYLFIRRRLPPPPPLRADLRSAPPIRRNPSPAWSRLAPLRSCAAPPPPRVRSSRRGEFPSHGFRIRP